VAVVHPAEAYAGLRLARQVVEDGQAARVELRAFSPGGQPAPGARLQVSVRRDDPQQRQVAARSVQADGAGRAALELDLSPGAYMVEARVAQGQASSEAPLWVVQAGAAAGQVADDMRLIADRDRYASGDIALMLPTLEYSRAIVLETVARSHELAAETRSLRAGEPLTATLALGDAGSLRVGVLALSGLDARPAFAQAVLPRVLDTAPLSVTLSARVTAPGDGHAAAVQLSVRDASGQPAPATMIVAIFADDGRLPSAGDSGIAAAPAPFAVAVGSQTWFPPDLSAAPGARGLVWSGPLRTSADGTLSVRLALADGGARALRIVAWAATAEHMGRGEARVQDATRAVLTLQAPAAVRVGDQVAITARLDSVAPVTSTLRVELAGLSGMRVLSAPPAEQQLGPGAQARLAWRVAFEPGEAARASVRVGDPAGLSLSQTISFTILAPATTVVTGGGALLNGTLRVAVGGADPGGQLHLELAPSPEALARAIVAGSPGPAVGATLDQASLVMLSATFTDTQPIALSAVARLAAAQNEDGGWGWWPGLRSQPAVTALVMEALGRAERSGVAIPARTRSLGLAWLGRALVSTQVPIDTQAQIAYVQSLYDIPQRELLARLADRQSELSAAGLAYVLLSQQGPGASEAAALRARLADMASRDGEAMRWLAAGDPATSVDDRAVTALALRALGQSSQGQAVREATLGWLLAARGSSRTGPAATYDDARLVDALREAAIAWVPARPEATLGDTPLITRPAAGITETVQLSAPLGQADSTLTVTSATTLLASYWVEHDRAPQPAPAAEIFVSRAYLDPATGQVLDTQALAVGQRARVLLTVVTPRPLALARLTDTLPTGAQALIVARDGQFAYVAGDTQRVVAFGEQLEAGAHQFFYDIVMTAAGQGLTPPAVLESATLSHAVAAAPQAIAVRP
jgi:uncharacterized protein YfaS (alpha-2-macroglobulin family)